MRMACNSNARTVATAYHRTVPLDGTFNAQGNHTNVRRKTRETAATA